MTKTIPDLVPVAHRFEYFFPVRTPIYLNMFGKQRSGDVTGRVALPALGGDETGGGEILGGRQHGDDLIVPHLSLPPAAEGDTEDHHD